MVIAQTVQIASLGMADSLILMVMALVVFGPRRLPQIGRQIGKLMYEFRKASNDFKFQMEEELRNAEEADRRKKEEERLRALALAAPAPAQVAASANPAATGTVAAITETSNSAAVYDNGPVAASQAAEAAPTIMPPSIGETVAAARGWSERFEQARLAEASQEVGGPAALAEERDGVRVVEPGTTPPLRARIEPAQVETILSETASSASVPAESASSQADSTEPGPAAAAQEAGIAVNHHG